MATDNGQITEISVGFDDLFVLETEGVDVFVLNWNEMPSPPPYYVEVEDRRFSYTGLTFLVRGHGAQLPRYIEEEEAEGRLTLFIERGSRYLVYSHDPVAIAEEEAEAEAEAAEAAEAEAAEAAEAEANEVPAPSE